MGRCKSLGLQESVCWQAPQLSGVNALVFSIVNPVTSWGTVKNIHMWNLEFLRGGRVLWGRGGSGPLAWLWLPCPNALSQVSPTGSELSMAPAPLAILPPKVPTVLPLVHPAIAPQILSTIPTPLTVPPKHSISLYSAHSLLEEIQSWHCLNLPSLPGPACPASWGHTSFDSHVSLF